MMKKLDKACILTYATVLTFCVGVKNDLRDMMDDEQGDIVQTVLLAMIAIVAAGVLLGVIRTFISTQGNDLPNRATQTIYGSGE